MTTVPNLAYNEGLGMIPLICPCGASDLAKKFISKYQLRGMICQNKKDFNNVNELLNHLFNKL